MFLLNFEKVNFFCQFFFHLAEILQVQFVRHRRKLHRLGALGLCSRNIALKNRLKVALVEARLMVVAQKVDLKYSGWQVSQRILIRKKKTKWRL